MLPPTNGEKKIAFFARGKRFFILKHQRFLYEVLTTRIGFLSFTECAAGDKAEIQISQREH